MSTYLLVYKGVSNDRCLCIRESTESKTLCGRIIDARWWSLRGFVSGNTAAAECSCEQCLAEIGARLADHFAAKGAA